MFLKTKKKRFNKFFIACFLKYMVQKIGMDCGAGDCEENNTTRTCRVGDSAWFLLICLWRSSFRTSTRYLIDSMPNLYLLQRSLLVGWGQFLAVGTFIRVFVGQFIKTVNPPFCFFWQTFSPDWQGNCPCYVG